MVSLPGCPPAMGALLCVRAPTSQPAEPGGHSPHRPEGDTGPSAGLCSLPDHLHREEHPEKRFLPLLCQGYLQRHVTWYCYCHSSSSHLRFLRRDASCGSFVILSSSSRLSSSMSTRGRRFGSLFRFISSVKSTRTLYRGRAGGGGGGGGSMSERASSAQNLPCLLKSGVGPREH